MMEILAAVETESSPSLEDSDEELMERPKCYDFLCFARMKELIFPLPVAFVDINICMYICSTYVLAHLNLKKLKLICCPCQKFGVR